MRALTSAASLLIAGALITGLTACGDGMPKAGVAASHSAATGHVYKPGEFMDVVIAAEKKAGSFQMALDANAGAAETTADASIIFDNGDGQHAMDMTMTDVDNRKMSVRLVGGQIYVAVDPGTGGKYVHVDPLDPTNPLARLAASMLATDPSSQLEDIRGAVTAVRFVGKENMFGGSTSHYKVTVNPSKITGQTAKSLNTGLIGKEFVYDYWLDAQGRPLQIRSATESDGKSVTVSIVTRSWGEVPPIVAPTADQLTTLKPGGLSS